MCSTCAAVSSVMLSTLERRVILAEGDAGLSPEWASRPLSAAERRAKVRFPEIMALEEEFLTRVAPIIGRLHEKALAAVVGAFQGSGGEMDPGEFLGRLEALVDSRPEEVAAAVDEATPEISAALAATYAGAGAVTLAEARRQGVKTRVRAAKPAADRFTAAARVAALEPYRRLLTGVQDRVATPANLSGPLRPSDLVPMALSEITTDSAVDQARQANHGAINAGRFDTAERLPLEYAYASEMMDKNTCTPCRAIDGQEWTSVAEVREHYPSGGGYVQCTGGARCRGTAVFVYDPEAEPVPEPEPEPVVDDDVAPRLAEPDTPEKAAHNANPRQAESRDYRENCTNVVVAYEARRRGYDVTAAPLRGRQAHEIEEQWGRKFQVATKAKEWDALMDAQPDGSRGIIAHGWKGTRAAHVYNWEKADGKVVYHEGQTRGNDANTYRSRVKWGKFGVRVMRVDDLEMPKDMIEEATHSGATVN